MLRGRVNAGRVSQTVKGKDEQRTSMEHVGQLGSIAGYPKL